MAREKDLVALFDLDGTLVDYGKALERDYARISAPGEEFPGAFSKDIPDYVIARTDLIKNQEGWWSNLERFKLGFDIYNLAVEMGFNAEVLSKGPSNAENAWTEKVKWVKRELGTDVGINLVTTKQGKYGCVLVDDYPGYLEPWLENRPRGVGIMPAHSYNKNFKHERVVRYDGSNISEVEKILLWARDRDAKEKFDKKKIFF